MNHQSLISCPYPGLRPFNEMESLYFKGRENHIMPVFVQQVLDKINEARVRGEVWQLSAEDKKLYGVIN